jgi:hypothetical protein
VKERWRDGGDVVEAGDGDRGAIGRRIVMMDGMEE